MVKEALMKTDGSHPNVKGHREIEQMIWEDSSTQL